MDKIVIMPHKGIKIWDKEILLWSNVVNLEKILWKWDFYSWEKISYHKILNHHISIFYNNEKKINYIELSSNYDKNYVYLNDINIFNEKVDKLLTLFVKNLWLYKNIEEWLAFDFINADISLWRPSKPEDTNEDLWENDYQKWIYFSVVWIWEKWYFN